MTPPERIPGPEIADAWIRECLSAGAGRAEVRVTGTCMEPALREGDRIRLRSPRGPARVGDIVLVRTPGGLRLHRVLLRFRDTIRTKGDRGAYLDPSVRNRAVVAVCQSDESRWVRFCRVARSLSRLLTRPFAAVAGAHRAGDGAHADVLP